MTNPVTYPLSDIYTGILMGVDLSVLNPGELRVVESDRRLRKEGGYNYINALWWQYFSDGRTVISVPPSTACDIRSFLSDRSVLCDLSDGCFRDGGESKHISRLRGIVDGALARIGLPLTNTCFMDEVYVQNGGGLRVHHSGNCRRLVDSKIPGADGVILPEQCFPDGIVYGIISDGVVAAVAYAHRTGTLEDKVADIGVVTGPGYQRRGYAKCVVSAVAQEITSVGGEAQYSCRRDNEASKRTAVGAGFAPYGKRFILSAE